MARRTLGVILAGGAARRFGSDKCLADWEGRPFIRRVADALLSLGDDLLILGRADVTPQQYHAVVPEARIKTDIQVQAGPVAALRAAIRDFRNEWLFVAPCDAPALTPELAKTLFDAGRAAKGPAVAKIPDGVLWDLFCTPRARFEQALPTAKRLEDLLADAKQVDFPALPGLNMNEPL